MQDDDFGEESYVEVEQVVVTEITTETWSEVEATQVRVQGTGTGRLPGEPIGARASLPNGLTCPYRWHFIRAES